MDFSEKYEYKFDNVILGSGGEFYAWQHNKGNEKQVRVKEMGDTVYVDGDFAGNYIDGIMSYEKGKPVGHYPTYFNIIKTDFTCVVSGMACDAEDRMEAKGVIYQGDWVEDVSQSAYEEYFEGNTCKWKVKNEDDYTEYHVDELFEHEYEGEMWMCCQDGIDALEELEFEENWEKAKDALCVFADELCKSKVEKEYAAKLCRAAEKVLHEHHCRNDYSITSSIWDTTYA